MVTVKQDGTGDFTQIQEAVDAVAGGDTILVWPGEYIENVIIEGKHLTLASLYLTTNDESYIDSTIINGNQSGSGVAILEDSDTTSLTGFSITNGSGYPVYQDYFNGGGVIVNYTSARIISCNIHDNLAYNGGGGVCIRFGHAEIENCRIIHNISPNGAGGILCIHESFISLKGTDITYNHAYYGGGGITIVEDSEAVFDSIDRCNIYLNYSGSACDVNKHNSTVSKIYADTLTVLDPGYYFILSSDDLGYPIDDIEIDANAAKITAYNGNLYVNPVSGDDDNSGTHPDSSLKTIAFANAKMKIDSMNRNTIHLASGIYSDSANNEKFPLNIRPFVNVKGKSREETILDGMFKSYLVKGNTTVSDYEFSNLTMQRGTMVDYDNTFNNTNLFGFIYYENNNITFDSVRFKIGIGKPGRSGFGIMGSKNVTVSNCIFEDVKGIDVLDISSFPGDTAYIYNSIFDHNKPDSNNSNWLYGRALRVHGAYDPEEPFVNVIQNCLFSNNDENAFLTTDGLVYLINNTYVNNSLESIDVAAFNNWASRGFMYNCISYNNGEYPFVIWELEGIPSDFSVYHSCIEGGEASFTVGQNSTLHYDPTNIDANPLFYNGPEYPYNLSSVSPCIDAGTLEIPEWIELYPYDLAGNPRIYGQSIDMGAYEWNPTVGFKKPALVSQKDNVLSAVPNPFIDFTTITIDVEVKTNMQIDMYNSSGQHIKRLSSGPLSMSPTKVVWDGTDKSGNECPQGLYFIIMSSDNLVNDNVKVVKMR